MSFIKNNSYILLIIMLSIAFTLIGVNKLEKEQTYSEIIVSEGDTLWKLAQMYSEKAPADQWIKSVMKVNNLQTSTIRKGEALQIPAVRSYTNEKQLTQLAGEE